MFFAEPGCSQMYAFVSQLSAYSCVADLEWGLAACSVLVCASIYQLVSFEPAMWGELL